jgi:hypothetical protein
MIAGEGSRNGVRYHDAIISSVSYSRVLTLGGETFGELLALKRERRATPMKSNYQDFGRYQDVDLAIARDGEASLALLIEAVKRLADPSRKSA